MVHAFMIKQTNIQLNEVSAEVIFDLLDENRPSWMKSGSRRYGNDLFSGNHIVDEQFPND